MTYGLRSYILNRGWIDKSQRHVPTYKEITGEKRKSKSKNAEQDDHADSDAILESTQNGEDDTDSQNEFDEEEFDDVAETFEQSYNFRYEEPYVLTTSF